ncbi:MAG: exodeoxyribonuclease VII small subunit [Anaerolineae bacterium]
MDEDISFEQALAELEETVAALEAGNLPLEKTLNLFERGQALITLCSDLLDDAQLRLDQLTVSEDGELSTTPMDTA